MVLMPSQLLEMLLRSCPVSIMYLLLYLQLYLAWISNVDVIENVARKYAFCTGCCGECG